MGNNLTGLQVRSAPGAAAVGQASRGLATRSPIPMLTTLRFFAAAEVVIYHYRNRIPLPTDFMVGLASAGYQAVTFFFTLSGFILVYVYTGLRQEVHLNTTVLQFWRSRIARISPAYFLGLMLLGPYFVYQNLITNTGSLEAFWLGLALVPTFLQAWWPPAALLWNSPAWSLSVEVFFYALFPFVAAATSRWSRSHFLLLAYSFVIIVSIWRIYTPAPQNSDSFWFNLAFYSPIAHLPQFMFGMALGRLYIFGRASSLRAHSVMFCVGTIGLVLTFGFRSSLPGWTQTDAVLILLFGLVIFGGAKAGSIFTIFLSPRLVLLGEASYSIYILHIPIAFWWSMLMRKLFGWDLPGLADFVIYFGLVIGLSILCFYYVETPLRAWISGRRKNQVGAAESLRLSLRRTFAADSAP